jgi:hypothetical protein
VRLEYSNGSREERFQDSKFNGYSVGIKKKTSAMNYDCTQKKTNKCTTLMDIHSNVQDISRHA